MSVRFEAFTSPEAILRTVERLGFLPFFQNEVPGFSIEEHTPVEYWFADTEIAPPEGGPWEWKGPIARTGRVAYGKFFNGRAGFISREWFPVFANYRRDGYDFDARYDDGLASHKDRQLYDLIAARPSILSKQLKREGNYGKDGNKGFDGAITRLQMQTYVIIADFEYMRDRHGKEYGWGVARYAVPERVFGETLLAEGYRQAPEESRRLVYARLKELFPEAAETQLRRLMGDGRR